MLVLTRISVLALALAAFAPGCNEGGADPSEPDGGPLPDSAIGRDAALGPDTSVPQDAGRRPGDECARAIPPVTTVAVTETRFASPLYVTQPPGSTDLYVVERGGLIRIIRGGAVLPTAFFDGRGLVSGEPMRDAEWGLLGLAFHPQYASNGRFFIYYTPEGPPWRNIIAEGSRSENPDVAETGVTSLITIEEFASNHNGGVLQFGPDGYLYIGTGDGGGRNDPMRTAQNRSSLLGKILRIDVSTPGTYSIPADNPFRGMDGARGEIWAYGLRNPWRISFDRETNDLWIGDVGQDEVEEIDYVPAGTAPGLNFGWSAFEGTAVFMGRSLPDGETHYGPLVEYEHKYGLSIVGGYVYRGSAIPDLRGTYFYADSYSGDYIRALRVCDGEVAVGPEPVSGLQRPDSPGAALVSFGEDNAGELYVVYLGSGEVLRIVAAD